MVLMLKFLPPNWNFLTAELVLFFPSSFLICTTSLYGGDIFHSASWVYNPSHFSLLSFSFTSPHLTASSRQTTSTLFSPPSAILLCLSHWLILLTFLVKQVTAISYLDCCNSILNVSTQPLLSMTAGTVHLKEITEIMWPICWSASKGRSIFHGRSQIALKSH